MTDNALPRDNDLHRFSEDELTHLLQKGYVLYTHFPGKEQLVVTYRSKDGDPTGFCRETVLQFDMFDPFIFRMQGNVGHVGYFSVLYEPSSKLGEEMRSTREMPFTQYTAYYFGQQGFPVEYLDQKFLADTTDFKIGRGTKYMQRAGQCSETEFGSLIPLQPAPSRHKANFILLGATPTSLYVTAPYRGLEGLLVQAVLHMLHHDFAALGYIAEVSEQYPLSFWKQFCADDIDLIHSLGIPLAGSLAEVKKAHHGRILNYFD